MHEPFNLVVLISVLYIMDCSATYGTRPQHKKILMCSFSPTENNNEQFTEHMPQVLKMCTHFLAGRLKYKNDKAVIQETFEKGNLWSWKQYPHVKKLADIYIQDFLILEQNVRTTRIKNTANEMLTRGFDGILLFWSTFLGKEQESKVLSIVQELSLELKQHGLFVTINAPISINFQIAKVCSLVKFVEVKVHRSLKLKAGPRSPLHGASEESIASTIEMLLQNGAERKKLLIIVPTMNVEFLYKKAVDPNQLINSTESKKTYVTADKLCEIVKDNSWVKKWYEEAASPYAVKGSSVVFYDDPSSVRTKVRYSIAQGLGGVGFNHLDLDDINGRCNHGKFPLLIAVHDALTASCPTEDIQELQRHHVAKYFWNRFRDDL